MGQVHFLRFIFCRAWRKHGSECILFGGRSGKSTLFLVLDVASVFILARAASATSCSFWGNMKTQWLFAIAWLGFVGVSMTATCQQVSVPEDEVKCTPEMTKKECQRARLDALFKKMDQASAAMRRAHIEAEHSLVGRYASAIQAAVTANWLAPDGLPNAACKVHIVQLPGGNVVSAGADASCPFDVKGRRSAVDAVLRTQTLPYKGFERVFQPNIDLIFFPPQTGMGEIKSRNRNGGS